MTLRITKIIPILFINQKKKILKKIQKYVKIFRITINLNG